MNWPQFWSMLLVTVKELPEQIVFCTKSNQEERIGRMVLKLGGWQVYQHR